MLGLSTLAAVCLRTNRICAHCARYPCAHLCQVSSSYNYRHWRCTVWRCPVPACRATPRPTGRLPQGSFRFLEQPAIIWCLHPVKSSTPPGCLSIYFPGYQWKRGEASPGHHQLQDVIASRDNALVQPCASLTGENCSLMGRPIAVVALGITCS